MKTNWVRFFVHNAWIFGLIIILDATGFDSFTWQNLIMVIPMIFLVCISKDMYKGQQ